MTLAELIDELNKNNKKFFMKVGNIFYLDDNMYYKRMYYVGGYYITEYLNSKAIILTYGDNDPISVKDFLKRIKNEKDQLGDPDNIIVLVYDGDGCAVEIEFLEVSEEFNDDNDIY
jgi:hypothetical protein